MRYIFSLLLSSVLLFSASSFAQFKSGQNTAGILGGFGGGADRCQMLGVNAHLAQPINA